MLLFANYDFYLEFDIQGVNNIVNPVVENQPTWLVDI
jgi:hypothetical protein